jgi:hypothetical protein
MTARLAVIFHHDEEGIFIVLWKKENPIIKKLVRTEASHTDVIPREFIMSQNDLWMR